MRDGTISDVIAAIRARVDLADVVRAAGVELRRSGSRLVGLCPFHGERTPSFYVTDDRFHCFGCSARGDVIDFVRATQSLELREAIELLGGDLDELASRPPIERPPAPERTPPPLDEVHAVWSTCVPVIDDPDVSAWLRGRGIDPIGVADLDLARALPRDASLPRWAGVGGDDDVPWRGWSTTGRRLVVPLYDARGRFRSLLGRRIISTASRGPKSLAPRGYSRVGLLMACPLAREVLAHGRPAWWTPDAPPLRVIVCEGEPDYLLGAVGPSNSTRWSDADEYAAAVIGIFGSSWSDELAARIPDGSRVTIATDPDTAGEQYAATILDSLRGRRVEVSRWSPN